MSKVAVVYWSGTGNTEAMAMAVAEGAKGNGCRGFGDLLPHAFSAEEVSEYAAIAFGLPLPWGAEQLEESEFEPMFIRLRGPAERESGYRPVRLLRLGGRRMDAQLGVPLQR